VPGLVKSHWDFTGILAGFLVNPCGIPAGFLVNPTRISKIPPGFYWDPTGFFGQSCQDPSRISNIQQGFYWDPGGIPVKSQQDPTGNPTNIFTRDILWIILSKSNCVVELSVWYYTLITYFSLLPDCKS
jgi:hypothetical protein